MIWSYHFQNELNAHTLVTGKAGNIRAPLASKFQNEQNSSSSKK